MLKDIYRDFFEKETREKIYYKRIALFKKNEWPKDVSFFYRNKVLFIHIPKAAGISVYKGLFDIDSFGHYDFKRYQKYFLNFQFKKLYKFTIVRNPYTRLQSAFHYLKAGGRGVASDIEYQQMLKGVNDFDEFILEWLNESNMEKIDHFRTQSSYLYNLKKHIKLDFIGKFEDLDSDYKIVSRKVNSAKQLPMMNKNPNLFYFNSISSSKTVIDKINRLYQEDFVNFDYKKLDTKK